MQHLEKRANLFYAKLTVPADVRDLIGKMRFVQSTQTSDKATARIRASLLVAGWKAEISKARGTLPDPKATFWESLRHDFINAADDGAEMVVASLAKQAALKMADQEEGAKLYKVATAQATPLDSLVTDWKASLRLAPKTIDQMHRDVLGMAAHFKTLEALTPKAVKAWTVTLLAGGCTASTLVRVGGSCRSLWRYLRDSDAVPVDAADPFAGSFKLAQKAAPKNTVNRQD